MIVDFKRSQEFIDHFLCLINVTALKHMLSTMFYLVYNPIILILTTISRDFLKSHVACDVTQFDSQVSLICVTLVDLELKLKELFRFF